ncbi:MAG: hypothetical protein JNL40_04420 [Cyclobacteriaceae bacterium]|nr:hypothetical protein [Cyclobacteriaceae bacterium]
MSEPKQFSFDYIRDQFASVLKEGYRVIPCCEYIDYKKTDGRTKVLVNRVDIDLSVKKARRLILIFNELNIKATFFVRLHAPEYNPFSFEHYKIIKFAVESGHELGYHSEVVDQAAIWNEPAADCLLRDIEIINRMFRLKIMGVASHGGMTGLNNLDFWKDRKAADFGLQYEAYDHQPAFNLFQECFYVSDSEWTRWKCYNKGQLVVNDRRSLAEHARDGHQVLHSLIHPDTYFDEHFYE